MPVVAVALALHALAAAPAAALDLAGDAPASVVLAQADDRLDEEDFGDAPPLPPPLEEGAAPAEPVGEAPPLPPPTLDEGGVGAPAPLPEDATDEPAEATADDEPASPLLTRTLQYGAGLGTLVACTGAGCLGLVCASPCLVSAFQPFAFTLPFLYPCVTAAALIGVGAGSGAAAGAVEGVVGDAFGEQAAGVLWPTVATAGTGAGLLALFAGAAMVSQVASAGFVTQTPLSLRFDSALGCVFASAAIVLAGAYCVGAPLAGVLAYGAVAPPSAPAAGAEAALSSAPTAIARSAGERGAAPAMAF